MFIVTERFNLLNKMYKETDIIYEAVANLEAHTGLNISVETGRREYDAIIQLDGQTLCVEAKANARKSNIGMILSQLEMQDKNKKWLFVADYLAKDVAEILQKESHNYLDVAGNAFIKTNNLFIFIEVKNIKIFHTNVRTNKPKLLPEYWSVRSSFRVLGTLSLSCCH